MVERRLVALWSHRARNVLHIELGQTCSTGAYLGELERALVRFIGEKRS
jgi:hypothetical protein